MTQYLAIDVGGTAIKHALIDEHYRLSERGLLPSTTLQSSDEFIESLAEIHDRHAGRVAGIAVSTCGELDPRTGHMFNGGKLSFNAGINLVDLLTARTGAAVSVENDANCALLAEVHDGSLRDSVNALVLVLGTAVGGAVMLDRRLYHGSHFHSGNASPTVLDVDAPYEPSRTLGMVGGVGGITGPLAARKGTDPATIDGHLAFDLVEAGDPDAVAVLDAYCGRLASFIYNTQLMLDLDTVAVGGGISTRASLVSALAARVDALFDVSFVAVPRPRLRPCRYRNDANLLGAVYHHLHQGSD